MNQALEILYEIYGAFVNWIFSATIFENVTIGWVAVSCFIFVIMIKNILNVPRSSRTIRIGGKKNE